MDEILKVDELKLETDPVKAQEKGNVEKVQEVQEGVQEQERAEQEPQILHEEHHAIEEEVQPLDFVVQCDKDEYLVKTIDWKEKKVRIITQNGKKNKK